MKRNHEGASGSIPASGNSTLPSARQLHWPSLLKPQPRMSTGNSAPTWAKRRPLQEINGEEHFGRVLQRRIVGEIFFYWLVDRSRLGRDGSVADYFERVCPYYLAGQLWRTLHPGRLCGFSQYIKAQKPNYGVIITRIDWQIWGWFFAEDSEQPIHWFPIDEEPLDFHTHEYLEISAITLRGQFSAWKKFPGTDLNKMV